MARMSLILLAAVSWTAAAAAADRPHVLLLLTDDQRRDTIHALGNPYIETPNLDRLVRSGVYFDRCYVQGSMVGAVCKPSREMLLTGRTLFHIDTQAALLPEVFRQAGYQTFATGKMHSARPYFNRMFEGGEELFFGGMGSHTALQVWDYDPSGRYERRARHRIAAFSSEAFATAAIRFLHQRDRSRPFFLYVAFTAPHDPRTPPEPYRSMYQPAGMPLPPNFRPLHPFDNGWMVGRDERLTAWPRTTAAIRQHLADYYGMITHLDAQIGRILDALEATGEAQRTLIVFASDNGLALGSHGLMGKQNLYEHSSGVPLIIAGPGIPQGRTCHALVYLLDLFPTLCELAGVPVPASVEGKSLAGVLTGKTNGVRRTLYTAFQMQRAVRNDRWKLIRYTHINKNQLFDLVRDPYELRNLANDPQYRPIVARLLEELRRWQKQLDDPHPLSAAHPADPRFVPPQQGRSDERRRSKALDRTQPTSGK